jgi:putative glutamine amidotransferase
VVSRPLVALTARRLATDRVRGWHAPGTGERASYMDRVRAAGGWPVLCDPTSLSDDEAMAFVTRFDALLLTGGPDVEPARYGEEPHPSVYGTDTTVDDFELALTRAAIATRTPLLAICRGLQVVNVALGGTLWQDIPTDPGVDPHGRPGQTDGELVHTVAIEPGSLLATVMGVTTPKVSCHHHQAVRNLGAGLGISARADDGTIEALELSGHDLIAVQWHPEDTAPHDPAQQALFGWLCRA